MNSKKRRNPMINIKTTLFSAMALGTIAAGFVSTEALADHRDGRGRGYGKRVVDVYVDAHHDPRLSQIIGTSLEQHNPHVNVVYSPRYADVTVRVNGTLSPPEIYDRRRGRRAGAYATATYNYNIRIIANGRTIKRERIRGEVSQPLERRYGYYPGSGDAFEKAERAIEIFGVFLETVTGDNVVSAHNPGRGRRGGGYDYAALERSLKQEAYQEIAYRVAHIDIPRPGGRRW